MRHNFGESEALLGVWWGWRGSSENEGGHGVLRGLFGGAAVALPAKWKKLFKKKVFLWGFVFKKKVGLFPLKEQFFGVPHFNAKFF